jgi:hypothetical protein
MDFPSGLQMVLLHMWSWVFSCVRLRTACVLQSRMAMSVEGDVFGLYSMASHFPSGDHAAFVSEISGVLVRLTIAPPSLGMAQISYISSPA